MPTSMVIKSFAERRTGVLFETGVSRRWSLISRVAVRKLVQIDTVAAREELDVPPASALGKSDPFLLGWSDPPNAAAASSVSRR